MVTNSAWARKYLGLYDYETQDINTRKMKVEGNCVIMKEHERLIKIDEKLDRRGITEVVYPSRSTSKTRSSSWNASIISTTSTPSYTRSTAT